jgi:HK97 gp10 family phage protein
MANATVQGIDRFKAKLAAIPESVRDAMSDALAGGAADLVAMQRRLAPKDTGELASSIRWNWADGTANADGLKAGRAEQIAAKGETNLAINVTTGTGMKIPMVAVWQEYGTRNQPAQPFFYVSYRAMKKKIAARVAAASRRAIKALGR